MDIIPGKIVWQLTGGQSSEFEAQVTALNFELQQVDVEPLLANNSFLSKWVRDEIADYESTFHNRSMPVVIGNWKSTGNVLYNDSVLCGWNQLAYAKMNGQKKIWAFVPLKCTMIGDITKIADIHASHISSELKAGIQGYATYFDSKQSLREHLYCPSTILDDVRHDPETNYLSPNNIEELENIDALLSAMDCVYFRMIS